MPPELPARPSLGVYVHFPWCLKKCPYCDFLSIAEERERIPGREYRDAVLRELECRAPALQDHRVETVFFGGGTPSLWQPEYLGAVLKGIRNHFVTEPGLEVTVECNPSSFNEAHARGLLAEGVNRISLGVQAVSDERLAFLGRLHSATGALGALQAAKAAGVGNLSADLIHGVFRQHPNDAVADVESVVAQGVQHVSAYVLTIEPGTQFGARQRKGTLPLLDEDAVAESYVRVSERLQALGFEHYEISNFARPGRESRHNLGYWEGRPYLGLGLGAWGTIPSPAGVVRYRNTVISDRYLAQAAWEAPDETNTGSGKLHQQFERLAPEVRVSERLLLGLRLRRGFNVAEVEHELGVQVLTTERKRTLDRLLQRGRIEWDAGNLRIPPSAWLHADGIIAELL